MVLFLIGYMGSGKSTMGRMIAKRLGIPFVDMDTQIEQQAGMKISDIFAAFGEERFREMEREWLLAIDPRDNLLVATGGGASCFGDNIDIMNRTGITVYLKMSPEKLLQRLLPGRAKRPLIRNMNEEELLEFISESLARREKYYSQAKLILDCDGVGDLYACEHIQSFVEMNARASQNEK